MNYGNDCTWGRQIDKERAEQMEKMRRFMEQVAEPRKQKKIQAAVSANNGWLLNSEDISFLRACGIQP